MCVETSVEVCAVTGVLTCVCSNDWMYVCVCEDQTGVLRCVR